MPIQHEVWAYTKALYARWRAFLMGSGVAAAIGWGAFFRRWSPAVVLGAIAAGFVVAGFRAWRDEHREVLRLTPTVPANVVRQLSELRAQGTSIVNLINTAGTGAWIRDEEEWARKIAALLRTSFSVLDEHQFLEPGTLPTNSYVGNAQANTAINRTHRRMDILTDIINRSRIA